MLVLAAHQKGSIEGGGELPRAEKGGLPLALALRAAHVKFHHLRRALGDLLAATGLGALSREAVGLRLLRRDAHTHAIARHGHALFSHRLLSHSALLRRQAAHQQLQIRELLTVDLQGGRFDFPQPRLQLLGLDEKGQAAGSGGGKYKAQRHKAGSFWRVGC